jgi:hypothetical protein
MSDYPSCWTDSHPTARIRHRCCECGGVIEPGEKYHIFSGVWDGEPSRYKTCSDCQSIRRGIRPEIANEIELGGLAVWFVDEFDASGLDSMLKTCDKRGSWQLACRIRGVKREREEAEAEEGLR